MLDSNPARIDKYGRLWSSYLKNKFSINESVELFKTEKGYHIISAAIKPKFPFSEQPLTKETKSLNLERNRATNSELRNP